MIARIFATALFAAYSYIIFFVGKNGYTIDETLLLSILGISMLYVFFAPEKKYRKNRGKPPLSLRADIIYMDGQFVKNAIVNQLDWGLTALRPIDRFLPKGLLAI